ncbi:MAG: ribose 5-phosphate isomerase A [Candidatus Atabeyarchaeum deiterrae]
MMTDPEALKKLVAREAVREVNDGDVIGLGSGTTIKHFIEELAKRIRAERISVFAVPTSYDTLMLASENGIRLTSLEEHSSLSKCFDGADKVDRNFNMIKGGGGCHTREKIVISASKLRSILVDHTKLMDRITGTQPIPVEIIPFSHKFVDRKLKEEGGVLKLRYSNSSKMGPVIGDNCGFLGDVNFPEDLDLDYIDSLLNSTPGIIEHGLFLRLADVIYIANENRVELLKKPKTKA